jgi:hypothetical protein
VQEVTINGNPWTDTFLEVGWKIYGPGGITDMIEGCTYGHGRDNSDKGTNKAHTQAFKYLLLDMLCISDPADDNDGTNQAADARRATGTSFSAPQADPGYEGVNGEQIPLTPPMETTRSGPPSDLPTPKQLNYAKALLKGMGLDDDEKQKAWYDVNIMGTWPGSISNITRAECSRIIELAKP